MTRFKDRIVVVVGGTSGIGLAAVEAFLDEGAQVIMIGRQTERLAQEAERLGPRCHGIVGDLADIESSRALMRRVGETFGRIDALFVNAGVGAFLPIDQATEADWDRISDINLKGAYFSIQQALPLMGEGSAIVLCGSAGHRKALAGNSIYSATKAGLRAIARTLALELVERGIRINYVSPGPTDTPIMDKAAGGNLEIAAEIRAGMAAAVPMKRLGRPEEIARAVLFLASDDASFITGIDLPVDGGLADL